MDSLMRRTPLLRRAPLRRKAPMKQSRVQPFRTRFSDEEHPRQSRSKPMRAWRRPAHTAADQEHLDAVASLGCIACELDGVPGVPACIHHVRRRPDGQKYGMGLRAPHTRTLPLCEGHHQGMVDTSKLAFHRDPDAFEARYGNENELLAKVDRRLEENREREKPLSLLKGA